MQPESNTPDLREKELIDLYKKGHDLAVLAKLYEPYMGLIYGLCMKYLKDREESRDAVMQIFEKLVEALKKHEVANFRSWLYVLARNHCLMALRTKKGHQFEEISPFLMETGANSHLDTEPDLETNISKLEHCLQQLVVEQQQCVRLFYFQQKCYREISAETGYDDNKVKSYIQNGKRNLRICMERNE